MDFGVLVLTFPFCLSLIIISLIDKSDKKEKEELIRSGRITLITKDNYKNTMGIEYEKN